MKKEKPAIHSPEWNTKEFFQQATLDQVEVCLKNGADPNAQTQKGESPLHGAAIYSENPEIIKALLKAGANPNAQTPEDTPPLRSTEWFYRFCGIDHAIIRLRTPLHWAAMYNDCLEITEALLAGGADPKATDEIGFLPSDLAKHNNNSDVRETLLEAEKKAEAKKQGAI